MNCKDAWHDRSSISRIMYDFCPSCQKSYEDLEANLKTALGALEYVARHNKDSILPAIQLDECSTVCKQAIKKIKG